MSWYVSLLLLLVAAVLWFGGTASRDDVFGMLAKIIATVVALVVVIFGHQLPLELLGLLVALSLPAARTFQPHPSAAPGGGIKPSPWRMRSD
ncbi:MAG: hypothetical protein ACKOCM_01885 [Cyanobacteriota bacterium]